MRLLPCWKMLEFGGVNRAKSDTKKENGYCNGTMSRERIDAV